MNGVFLPVLIALVVNTVLGIIVYRTNRNRSVNKQFLTLTSVITTWLACLFFAFHTGAIHRPDLAQFFIRQASVAGAFIPFAFNLLRLSILYPSAGLREIVGESRLWLAVVALVAVLCQTRWYIESTVRPAHGSGNLILVEPIYGAGGLVYGAYFITALVLLFYRYVRDIRQSTGIRRIELQFISLGYLLGIFLGISLATLIPLFYSGTSQSVRFAPLSVIVSDGVIAYGIATRHILDVAYIIRRATAYVLVTLYLICVYVAVWLPARVIPDWLPFSSMVPHVLASLAVAFSLAPAHGFMQRFADRLFINRQSMDIGLTMENANRIFRTVRRMRDLLRRFAAAIGESVGTDRVVIMLSKDSSFQQSYPERPEADTAIQVSRKESMIRLLSEEKCSLTLDELARRRPSFDVGETIAKMKEFSAAIIVGIYAHGELVGLLLLGPRLSGRIYSGVEQNVLEMLCFQLAVAIENAQLYTQAQDSGIYLEILLDSLVGGVVAIDIDGIVTVFNREAQRICRTDGAAVVNHSYKNLPKALVRIIDKTLTSGHQLRDVDIVLFRDSEFETPIRAGSAVFHNHSGKRIGTLIVFNDLSVIKRLESQMRRTDRLASIGTLSTSMAHEIKNPLVAIKTFTQLLPERYDDQEFRESFNNLMCEEVNRIDNIVSQLLQFSRPIPVELAPCHMNEVLEHAIHLIEHRLKQSDIKMELCLNAKRDVVNADKNQMQQVFFNLLLNATESMRDGGRLTIRTTSDVDAGGDPTATDSWRVAPQEVIRVSIEDTGAGINEEDVCKIFDPFFTTKADGTGMGLAVVHGIVLEHGGTIDVESEPNIATAFEITLPLCEDGEVKV